MSQRITSPRTLLLRVLRIPPEPDPPAGSPGSLRSFRAATNFLHFRRALWLARQLGVLIVLGVWIIGARSAFPDHLPNGLPRNINLITVADWVLVIKVIGVVLTLIQMPFTYALVVMDYELRWYMVTDRSLRIREGLTRVREMTVSFANIQNISLRQGPLQRLLGLHDLLITTAGGGGSSPHHNAHGTESFHTGIFRGVDNAGEIRDLILSRLRELRGSGLGDPDEPISTPSPPAIEHSGSDTLAAAREVLAETRAWRATFSAAQNAKDNPA